MKFKKLSYTEPEVATTKKWNWKYYLLIILFIVGAIYSILDIFNIIPLLQFQSSSAEETIVIGIVFYSSVILVSFLIFRKKLNKNS